MEDAEAIIDGAESIDVVFEPISRLGLHSEQDAIWFQQCSDLGQRDMRGCEIMDAVARGYQIEVAICIEFSGRLREELQLRTYPGRRSRGACPRDRVSVWIDTDYFTIGKSLCDRDADTANATTNIQDATTLFEALDDIG